MKFQNENELQNYKKMFKKIQHNHPQLKGVNDIDIIEFLPHYIKFLIQVLVFSNFEFKCKTFILGFGVRETEKKI